VKTPDDAWLALTRMALRLMRDLSDERQPIDPGEVVDATLAAFPDVRDVYQYRDQLEAFVRAHA
jgi:hypothetical protein